MFKICNHDSAFSHSQCVPCADNSGTFALHQSQCTPCDEMLNHQEWFSDDYLRTVHNRVCYETREGNFKYLGGYYDSITQKINGENAKTAAEGTGLVILFWYCCMMGCCCCLCSGTVCLLVKVLGSGKISGQLKNLGGGSAPAEGRGQAYAADHGMGDEEAKSPDVKADSPGVVQKTGTKKANNFEDSHQNVRFSNLKMDESSINMPRNAFDDEDSLPNPMS